MAIRIACERCGKKYKVEDHFAGRRTKCRVCGTVLEIPQAGDSPDTIRHKPRSKPFEAAEGDDETIDRVDGHIRKHLGPVASVFHELVSDLVHLDVHFVAASQDRPVQTLVTSGMSSLPMTVPPDCAEFERAELFLSLPPDWPLDQESMRNERHYWPIRWLKTLARLPHEYETWLGIGHTIPNGDPPEKLAADTRFCGFMLGPPLHAPMDFHELETDSGEVVWMWALYPLYREEIDFKLAKGAEALFDRLAAAGVTEVVDVGRQNVCRKR